MNQCYFFVLIHFLGGEKEIVWDISITTDFKNKHIPPQCEIKLFYEDHRKQNNLVLVILFNIYKWMVYWFYLYYVRKRLKHWKRQQTTHLKEKSTCTALFRSFNKIAHFVTEDKVIICKSAFSERILQRNKNHSKNGNRSDNCGYCQLLHMPVTKACHFSVKLTANKVYAQYTNTMLGIQFTYWFLMLRQFRWNRSRMN